MESAFFIPFNIFLKIVKLYVFRKKILGIVEDAFSLYSSELGLRGYGFSPGFLVPVGKPGLKAFPNQY